MSRKSPSDKGDKQKDKNRPEKNISGLYLLAEAIEIKEQNRFSQVPQFQPIDLSLPSTSQRSSFSSSTSGTAELQCEHCARVFIHRGDLNKHLRSHTGEQPYTCTVCNKRFAQASNMTRHQAALHSGGVRPFQCTACGKTFNRKDKLDEHRNKGKSCKN